MTLTGMKKHVGVLEAGNRSRDDREGRSRADHKLGPRRLADATAWIESYRRKLWDALFDELDNVLEELKQNEKVDGHKKRK